MTASIGKHLSPETERDEILEAAMACFTEIGYGGTSIDAIAARSGLPKATVSHHFADKAEIRTAPCSLVRTPFGMDLVCLR